MKTLRYLLIAMVMVLASVTAQAQFTQNNSTEYQFQSTSTMAGSGSSLPQSAVTGTSTAGDCPAAYAPSITSGPRKTVGGGDTADDDDPDAPSEPFPVGDGTWALMLMAFGYAGYIIYRRRKVVKA